MAKKDSKVDSTTDFFLNFISKENEKKKDKPQNKKKEEEQYTSKIIITSFKLFNWVNELIDKAVASTQFIAILSLILTLVLLVVINGSNISSILSTPTSGDYITNVPISVKGSSDDYEVTISPETENIMLIGSSLDIYTAKIKKNYSTYVDITGYGEGTYPVNVEYEGFDKDLDVALSSQQVTVKISKVETYTYTLDYSFVNKDKMDDSYSVKLDSIDEQEVKVSGGESTLAKIDKIIAEIDCTNVTEGFEQDAPIYAYDQSGNRLDVTIEPKKAHVICSVASASKEVPIVVTPKGELPDGFSFESFKLSDKYVTMYGTQNELNKIDYINAYVSVTGLNQNQTFKGVTIEKPSNVNELSVDKVDITVNVTQEVETKDVKVKVKAVNVPKGLKATISSKAKITISGTKKNINSFKTSDLSLTVDCSNLTGGTTKQEVNLSTDNYLLQYNLKTKKIDVKLEEK